MKKILFLLLILAPWLAQAGAPYIANLSGVGTNTLFYGGGAGNPLVLDILNTHLVDPVSGQVVVDWADGTLIDASLVTVLDWANRRLINAAGNPVFHWRNSVVEGDGSSLTNFTKSFGIQLDGGGSAITTGLKGCVEIPANYYLTSAKMVALNTGSLVVNLWKTNWANLPPTSTETICSATPVTITTTNKVEDSTMSGWTRAIPSGSWIYFNVDSCTDITNATLCLKAVTY